MDSIKFSQILKFQEKSHIKAGDGLTEGSYPFFTSSPTLSKYSNSFQFNMPSLIFGTGGNASIHLCENPFSVSTDCLVAQLRSDFFQKFDIKFIYYYLSGNIWILEQGFKGAGLKHISKGFIDNIDIPKLTLDDQKRIVEVFDKVDYIRQKRKESLNLLDDYLRSVFLDMFGDPLENEKQWDVKKLKDLSIKILSGNTPKGGSQVYVKQGVLFLRSQNVWRNRLALDDVAFISEETHNKMRNSSLEYKDLVMTKTGRINTENSSLGRAAIYLGEDNRANINGHVYLIRLKKNVVHEFVLFILTTKEYREYIRKVCVGGIDKRQINKVHLEEFPIIFPPIDQQYKFLEMIHKTESLKQKMLKQSGDLDIQFQALMQKSFNTIN